ncbi:hypothetical protein Tco_1164762 [Tanacetum coccineum]
MRVFLLIFTNRNDRGVMPITRECTYHDFVKCQPLNFKGTKGVVGLTRWFKKLETVFHIANVLRGFVANDEVIAPRIVACCAPNVPEGPSLEVHWRPPGIISKECDCVEHETQNAIWIANNLMDKKLKGYAAKSRHNVGGQSVARAYTAGNNERKGYAGPLPYCNKCKLHHEGSCIVKCRKCNKVRHITRDCINAVAATATQRAPVMN